MAQSFRWSRGSEVSPDQWRAFCLAVSVMLSRCASIPLGDEHGNLVEADAAFLRLPPLGTGTDGFDALPISVRINGVDSESGTPFALQRDSHEGAFSTGHAHGHLVYGALLLAASTLNGFKLQVECTEQEGGYGMALAQAALVEVFPNLPPASVESFFASFPGAEEAQAMAGRAAGYGKLIARVDELIASADGKEPAGRFEVVTLRTARAVRHRLQIGVDHKFDAEYSLHSLEGFFNQSKFLEPAPQWVELNP